MQLTKHASQRMNQRGVPRRLVEFTMRHGRIEGNRRVLDRQESRRLIEALTEELKLAKRVMDKGGVVVVDAEQDTIVTTYNVNTRPRHVRRLGSVPTMAEIGAAANARAQFQVQALEA